MEKVACLEDVRKKKIQILYNIFKFKKRPHLIYFEKKRSLMPHYPDEIEYSDKYFDDFYEYRHVILPKNIFKKI